MSPKLEAAIWVFLVILALVLMVWGAWRIRPRPPSHPAAIPPPERRLSDLRQRQVRDEAERNQAHL